MKLEHEQARRREVETHRRTIRAVEFRQTLEEKERVKHEERARDFEWDRAQVERAIREAEEVKRREEEKRLQLRVQQSKFVE